MNALRLMHAKLMNYWRLIIPEVQIDYKAQHEGEEHKYAERQPYPFPNLIPQA